jgi:uncharacterized protein (UPF0261 family)
VVVPGGLEYFCFGAPESIPQRLRERKTHHHNPYNTNVRTSSEELRMVGELMAERLNGSRGPVVVLIPTRGWSEVGSPGGVLHDPQVNAAFAEVLSERLDPKFRLQELDMAINDPAFARLASDMVLELLDRERPQDLQATAVTEARESGTGGPEGEPRWR